MRVLFSDFVAPGSAHTRPHTFCHNVYLLIQLPSLMCAGPTGPTTQQAPSTFTPTPFSTPSPPSTLTPIKSTLTTANPTTTTPSSSTTTKSTTTKRGDSGGHGGNKGGGSRSPVGWILVGLVSFSIVLVLVGAAAYWFFKIRTAPNTAEKFSPTIELSKA